MWSRRHREQKDGSFMKMHVGLPKNHNKLTVEEIDNCKSLQKRASYALENLTEAETKTLTLCKSLYLKHTDNIYCIDVDEVGIDCSEDLQKIISKNKTRTKYQREQLDDLFHEIIAHTPYTKGNTKGIHIYIKIRNVPANIGQIDVFKDFKGDLIKDVNNMWERTNKLFSYGTENGNLIDMEEIDYEEIEPSFKNSFTSKTKATKWVEDEDYELNESKLPQIDCTTSEDESDDDLPKQKNASYEKVGSEKKETFEIPHPSNELSQVENIYSLGIKHDIFKHMSGHIGEVGQIPTFVQKTFFCWGTRGQRVFWLC
jgi:hypothetical protein